MGWLVTRPATARPAGAAIKGVESNRVRKRRIRSMASVCRITLVEEALNLVTQIPQLSSAEMISGRFLR